MRRNKKTRLDEMTPEELNNYVQNLPEERPPQWSSAALLAGAGIVSIAAAFMSPSLGWNATTITYVLFGIGALAGAGYLVYKILKFYR